MLLQLGILKIKVLNERLIPDFHLNRYLTGQVDKRTLEKYEREAKEKNRESWLDNFPNLYQIQA